MTALAYNLGGSLDGRHVCLGMGKRYSLLDVISKRRLDALKRLKDIMRQDLVDSAQPVRPLGMTRASIMSEERRMRYQ
jgi:hypothetical protein